MFPTPPVLLLKTVDKIEQLKPNLSINDGRNRSFDYMLTTFELRRGLKYGFEV